MFWKNENNETKESQVTVLTFNGIKEHCCPKCHLPLLKRPFDETMKTNGKYETQAYDYHCAVCNKAYDRFAVEIN